VVCGAVGPHTNIRLSPGNWFLVAWFSDVFGKISRIRVRSGLQKRLSDIGDRALVLVPSRELHSQACFRIRLANAADAVSIAESRARRSSLQAGAWRCTPRFFSADRFCRQAMLSIAAAHRGHFSALWRNLRPPGVRPPPLVLPLGFAVSPA